MRLATEFQSPVELVGAAGEVLAAPGEPPAVSADPWKMWIRPVPLAPVPYSEASIPIRRSKHSSESAPPVEIAMLGMSPSLWFEGSVSFVAIGLSVHELTLATEVCFRHLPI